MLDKLYDWGIRTFALKRFSIYLEIRKQLVHLRKRASKNDKLPYKGFLLLVKHKYVEDMSVIEMRCEVGGKSWGGNDGWWDLQAAFFPIFL